MFSLILVEYDVMNLKIFLFSISFTFAQYNAKKLELEECKESFNQKNVIELKDGGRSQKNQRQKTHSRTNGRVKNRIRLLQCNHMTLISWHLCAYYYLGISILNNVMRSLRRPLNGQQVGHECKCMTFGISMLTIYTNIFVLHTRI